MLLINQVRKQQLLNFLESIHIQFKDIEIYSQAFTHSSFCVKQEIKNNQRLEFLGDSVLSLCISEYIYDNFPEMPEGKLTKIRSFIVSEKSLSSFARELKLDQLLLLGQGEENCGGRTRDAVIADAFEAFLAAVFIDSGIEEVKRFLIPLFHIEIEEVSQEDFIFDYKTEVQYLIQKKYKKCPEYKIVREEGPPHDKKFHAEILVNGKAMEVGVGCSKKKAEEDAAKKFWTKIKNKEVDF